MKEHKLQHYILNLILFISSVLFTSASLSTPLASVINSDTQQVEYVENKQTTISLKLEEILLKVSPNKSDTYSVYQSYIYKSHFLDTFHLYKDSMSLIVTLNTQHQYRRQKTILLKIAPKQLHQQYLQIFSRTESKRSAYKNFC